MRHAPALRDGEVERLGELFGGLRGKRAAPRAEVRELASLRIERKVAVHHAGYPERVERVELLPRGLAVGRLELRECGLHALHRVLETVAPHVSGKQTVLPSERTGCKNLRLFVHQHRLDASGPELYPQYFLHLLTTLHEPRATNHEPRAANPATSRSTRTLRPRSLRPRSTPRRPPSSSSHGSSSCTPARGS